MAHRNGWARCAGGLALVLLLIVQTGCDMGNDLAGVTTAGEGVLQRSHSRYSSETGARTYIYEVQPADEDLEVCVRIVLQAGVQDWQLTDPSGHQTRWKAEVDGGQAYRASHCFDVEAGDWELQISMEGATGEHEITWHSRMEGTGD